MSPRGAEHDLTFDLLQVWGDSRVSVSEVLPQLIRPVASGHSDLTFAEYSDSVSGSC